MCTAFRRRNRPNPAALRRGRATGTALMGLALATLAGLSIAIAPAQAELTRSDQAALLWSTQLRFDESRVPVVPIAIVDDMDRIRVSSPDGFRIELDPEGATAIELPGVREVVAEVVDGRPAELAYYASVGRYAAQDLDAIQAAQRTWKERHFQTIAFELGSVFGFYGRVLDSRAILVAIDQPHDTREAADETLSALASAYPDMDAAIHPVVKQRPTGRVTIRAGQNTITAIDMARLRSLGRKPLQVHEVMHGKGFSWEARSSRSYHGEVVIAPDRRGKTAAVNPVNAETLLRGLVPSEIYTSSPPDALAAQAIVARGELLAKIGHRHLTDPYVVCSDVHCQVYKGAGQEHPRTDQAVADTRGLMVFDSHGLVDAVYSANCGGHTEANEHAWFNEPEAALRGTWDAAAATTFDLSQDAGVTAFLKAGSTDFCALSSKGSKNHRWTMALTAQEVADALGPERRVGTPTALVPTQRGVSGRIIALRVEGTDGHVELRGELVIRRALGGLKSSLFVVETSGGTPGAPARFTLLGGGFGHGVGMCQTGAIGAAESGWNYERILKHYYQGSAVERVY